MKTLLECLIVSKKCAFLAWFKTPASSLGDSMSPHQFLPQFLQILCGMFVV